MYTWRRTFTSNVLHLVNEYGSICGRIKDQETTHDLCKPIKFCMSCRKLHAKYMDKKYSKKQNPPPVPVEKEE